MDELIRENGFTVTELCSYFKIPRSSYYKWKNRVKPTKEIQDEEISTLIAQYHIAFDGILGYRRMRMYINKLNGRNYSAKYILRLMRKIDIQSRIRKKRSIRSKPRPEEVAENILNRDFKATRPNQKWLTDVTEFTARDGKKIYLSAILDLYDKSIVSYVFSFRNNNSLVFKTFDLAIEANKGACPIFHSDRGFQYTNKAFKDKLDNNNMVQSMSRVGMCIDNGPMEGFWGILKSETYYDKTFENANELIKTISNYIDFYNNERLQDRLQQLSPIEYRRQAILCL